MFLYWMLRFWVGACAAAIAIVVLDWSFLSGADKGARVQALLTVATVDFGHGYFAFDIHRTENYEGSEVYYRRNTLSPFARANLWSDGTLSVQYPIFLVCLVLAGGVPVYVAWRLHTRKRAMRPGGFQIESI